MSILSVSDSFQKNIIIAKIKENITKNSLRDIKFLRFSRKSVALQSIVGLKPTHWVSILKMLSFSGSKLFL